MQQSFCCHQEGGTQWCQPMMGQVQPGRDPFRIPPLPDGLCVGSCRLGQVFTPPAHLGPSIAHGQEMGIPFPNRDPEVLLRLAQKPFGIHEHIPRPSAWTRSFDTQEVLGVSVSVDHDLAAGVSRFQPFVRIAQGLRHDILGDHCSVLRSEPGHQFVQARGLMLRDRSSRWTAIEGNLPGLDQRPSEQRAATARPAHGRLTPREKGRGIPLTVLRATGYGTAPERSRGLLRPPGSRAGCSGPLLAGPPSERQAGRRRSGRGRRTSGFRRSARHPVRDTSRGRASARGRAVTPASVGRVIPGSRRRPAPAAEP